MRTALKLFILIFFLSRSICAQNIISRNPLDYPEGQVPGICNTDPTDPDCIIKLAPALPDEDYTFQIPLVNELDRTDLTFIIINVCGCSSGEINFSADGTITMLGSSICQSGCLQPYLEISVNVINNNNASNDEQDYIIPIYRNPLSLVLALDVSNSMSEVVPGGTDTRWNVLKNSVNQFTDEFEKYYQEGDSISVIYYSEDTVMPGSPIDSVFIAITPDDFTPSNLKSSEIINADMQNQTLQGSAAMGNALLLAKQKLQKNDATKVVILFTDGFQDKEPFVHKLDGNKLYNGELLNDESVNAIDSIRYYTVGMGSSSSIPVVLKSIAQASEASFLNATTGIPEDNEFHYFFQNYFDNLLKGIPQEVETRMIDLSPFDDSLNVAVDRNLIITYDEPVNVNSGFINIKRRLDDSELESINVNSGLVSGNGTSVITINPDNYFESNTEYYVLIDGNAFKNNADITVEGIYSDTFWNFSTEDITSPDVSISTLESDPTSSNPFEITIEFSEEINGFYINEIDVINGSVHNLTTTDSIEFASEIIPLSEGLVSININSGVATDNAGNLNTAADEFTIAYSVPTNVEMIEKAGISIYANDGFVIVDLKNPNLQSFKSGDIEIYSINGSLIKKERLENNSRFKTYLNNQQGIYLVKLTLDNSIYYTKIQN